MITILNYPPKNDYHTELPSRYFLHTELPNFERSNALKKLLYKQQKQLYTGKVKISILNYPLWDFYLICDLHTVSLLTKQYVKRYNLARKERKAGNTHGK